MGVYVRPERKKSDDMRFPGEAFCADCPDHEACMGGWPCWRVREVHNEWAQSHGKPEEMVESGEMVPATPIPFLGWKAKTGDWFFRWGFPRMGQFMAWWDERGLGK